MDPKSSLMLRACIIAGAMFFLFMVLVCLLASPIALITFLSAVFLAVYFLFHLEIQSERERKPRKLPPVMFVAIILLTCFFIGALFAEGLAHYAIPLSAIIAVGLALTFWTNFLTIPLAIYHKQNEEREGKYLQRYPKVSIIVPAYNEEENLATTIEALLEADYPLKEIIIVDDGSTDGTLNIARRYIDRGVKVCHKENGGKASAINYGLLFATGEIIVLVDADTIIGYSALREIVKRFEDPEVVAVCGNIKILNTSNWLTKCQALEYCININILRRAFDTFGAVPVVPGSLGAFRKEVLEAGGKYDRVTVTEDFDVTIQTLKTGKVVQASSYALAYTRAPETISGLYKQRLRWYRGNIQSILRHKDAFINTRYGFLHSLAFPFIFLSLIILPFIGLLVWGTVFLMLFLGYWQSALFWFLFFVVLQFLLSLLALELDEAPRSLAWYSPLFVLGYKQFLDFIIIKSLFDVLLKRNIGWTSAKRKQEKHQ